MTQAPDERRRGPREPLALKVEYDDLEQLVCDYTENISKGGTFIKTKKTLPVGTRFLFRLTVPGRERPFELKGDVVHANPSGEEPGMGIRFVWGEDRERVAFENAVEGLMSESLGDLVTRHLLHKR